MKTTSSRALKGPPDAYEGTAFPRCGARHGARMLSPHMSPPIERRAEDRGGSRCRSRSGAAGSPRVAARMMSVGERSGDMGGMCAQIARFTTTRWRALRRLVHAGLRADPHDVLGASIG